MFVFFRKFYEPTAILADPVNGPLVANLLGTVNTRHVSCLFESLFFDHSRICSA